MFDIPWVKPLVFILGGILGGMVLGWVVGKIIARIKYPDPNKTRLYSGKQLLVVMGVVAVSIGLILFAVLYQPKAEDPSDPPLDPAAGGEMLPGEEEVLPTDGELTEGGEPAADAEGSGEEEKPTPDVGAFEEEEESAEAPVADTPVAMAPAGAGAVAILR